MNKKYYHLIREEHSAYYSRNKDWQELSPLFLRFYDCYKGVRDNDIPNKYYSFMRWLTYEIKPDHLEDEFNPHEIVELLREDDNEEEKPYDNPLI